MEASSSPLTEAQRRSLLAAARESIVSAVGGAPDSESDASTAVAATGVLGERRGAFVTLRTHGGDLRGCVGTFQPRASLLETVREMARAAAFDDPRFPPLRREELGDLHIDISVLSPLEPARPEDVKVGVHGLCVQRGFHRGVLLPQVATEEGWDAATFLDHTCMKAGLAPGAWRDSGTGISTFTAEVFEE
jgi:uncharacterized protein